MNNICCSFRSVVAAVVYVDVGASDYETHALGSTLTEALRFRQEGHPKIKCYSAPIKSSSKIWWSGIQPYY